MQAVKQMRMIILIMIEAVLQRVYRAKKVSLSLKNKKEIRNGICKYKSPNLGLMCKTLDYGFLALPNLRIFRSRKLPESRN